MRLFVPGIILLSLLAQGEEEKAGLEWWAFQTVERPPVTVLEEGDGLAPIDSFVRAQLSSSPATRRARSAFRATLLWRRPSGGDVGRA